MTHRRLILAMLLSWASLLPLAAQPSAWVLARRKPGPEPGRWAWLKVLPNGRELPFFLVFESGTDTESDWRWMSDTGGRLRWFHTEGADSLLLEEGQLRCRAQETATGWVLRQGRDSLLLRRLDPGWLVERIIPPQQEGQRSIALPLLRIVPHPRRANVFRIEDEGLLEDLPGQLLLLGIVVAVAES